MLFELPKPHSVFQSFPAFELSAACAFKSIRVRRFYQIAVLPNYSSLTSICARVNKYCAGRLAGVTLVHDDQTHCDELLRGAKANVEALVDTSDYEHLGADYSFGEHASLAFESSDQIPGLMIADVIAGYVRQILREHAGEGDIRQQAWDAFLEIWGAGDIECGAVMNLLLPNATVERPHHRMLLRRHERAQEPVAPRRRNLVGESVI